MEKTILSHLLYTENYARKVIPFLKPDYFQSLTYKTVYELIDSYVKKYNTFPTKEALFIDLNNASTLNEDTFKEVAHTISSLEAEQTTNMQWLLDNTEKFCQDKALFNAIRDSIKIMDGNSASSKGAIPTILQEALQVSFDTTVGHDFIDDADSRYDVYHAQEERLQFDLDYFNTITNGGIPSKTLSCFIASTGGGKSLAMCHMAAYNLMCNKNVLYITLEMAEERIAQRIDANLMDVTIDKLMSFSKEDYIKKMNRVKKNTKGKLIIKEYPTASAGSAHFRHLLNELRIKKNFEPDVIYIDYLNLCVSSRIKMGSQVNTYSYVKAIAEELRGLAVEYELPIITATQANRGAFNSSDMGLENTSDSIGLPQTVDFMAALISTEELEELDQLLVKQLKNRFGSINLNKRFVIGIDRSKMKLYNVDASAQEDIIEGPEQEDSKKTVVKLDKTKFKGFK